MLSKAELLTPGAMNDVQVAHLKFLESWGASMSKIYGVSVPQILTYETIQIVNDAYLKAVTS
jgi:hypothetical protein